MVLPLLHSLECSSFRGRGRLSFLHHVETAEMLDFATSWVKAKYKEHDVPSFLILVSSQ